MTHACELCGRSGADHETPKGTWIHRACGLQVWNRLCARLNRVINRR